MYRKTARWISWFVLITLCMSLFTLPAMAAEGQEEPAGEDATEEVVSVEEAAIPLVNVISEDTGAADPAEESPSPVSEPAAETAEPEAGAEPEDPASESRSDDVSDPSETEPAEAASGEIDGDIDGDGEETAYTVSYYRDDTLIDQEEVLAGGYPANIPAADDTGRSIKAWTDGEGKKAEPAETAIEADTAFYAWFMPQLATEDHSSYINGVGNAKFSPTASLTRAQAATILYKLLDSQERGPFSSSFSDVSAAAWYAEAVTTLASIGVINGYTDGSFRPNRAVTRAEFVTMLVNLTGVTGASASFTDVSSHWARNAIYAAASQGWVNGYAQSDGTYAFRPGNNITRAEAVVVMNRILGRSADDETIAGGDGILHFIDVSASAWYYGDVMEASIGHSYSRAGGSERWTGYNKESTGLSAGIHKIDSTFVYIDGNGQPAHMDAGITKLDGNYYYSPTAGYTFTSDLSSKEGYVVFASGAADQALTTGFNQIGSALFYWDLETDAPQALIAGLNDVAGKTYWADQDGYIIRNDFGKGVVSLGGKNYLSDGYCAIITTGYAYRTDNSKPANIDLKNKTYEFNNAMYYVKEDYSLATNAWVGYLYFGSNSKYTSGDSTLDGYVENVVRSFIDNNALTRVQKLLKAYIYLRGDWDSSTLTFTSHGFSYSSYNALIFDRGVYKSQSFTRDFMSCAKHMLTLKYGMCYQWAAAYCYLARRIGMQTYLVVGGIFSNNALHCWNMIYWDGYWHISDVEIEWGWLQGYYGGGLRVYRNLFDQTVATDNLSYYQNPEVPTVCYTFPI